MALFPKSKVLKGLISHSDTCAKVGNNFRIAQQHVFAKERELFSDCVILSS